MAPRTRYAKLGDLNLAYQVFGEGPPQIVFVPGFVSNVELHWSAPAVSAWLERLGSFARVVIFDKAGTGLSDPIPGPRTLEQRGRGGDRHGRGGLRTGSALRIVRGRPDEHPLRGVPA